MKTITSIIGIEGWYAMKYAPMIFLCLITGPLFAQDADSEHLRDLLKNVPQLPMDRIELSVSSSLVLEGISAVTVGKQGNIYVLHRPVTGDPVVVLDPKGNFLRSWGKGMFKIPHGIRIDPAGNVWTVDANTSNVYKFTPEGTLLLEINVGDIPDPSRDFCGATDIAFAENNHVFVADGYCNGRVVEFDADGQKVHEWGKRGTGPSEFIVAHSIAVSPQGDVYVADRENGRLQWFDQHGKFLGQWKYGGQLFSVAFSPAEDLYVGVRPRGVPQEFNVVKIDPATGEMLGRIEVRAHELAFSPDGALWPATRSGELLLFRPSN